MIRNPYFKTTSRKQDRIAQTIFQGFNGLVHMGCDFNQRSGICTYHYYLQPDNKKVLTINVSRDGQLVSQEESTNV